MNQSWRFFRYGLTWFLPYEGWMSIDLRPPFPTTFLTFPQVLGPALYLATLAAGTWLLVRFRDWRALLGLSVLLPGLLFASEFATVWVQDPLVLYRSYLWGIGVPGIVFFLAHGISPRILVFVGFVFGGWMVWQAGDRVLSMANPEKVWTDAIQKMPDDPRAVGRWFPHLNRGNYYLENASPILALKDFEASSKLGDMGMGAYNVGSILMSQGKAREALGAFDLAEKQGYALYNLYCQRGGMLLAQGTIDMARDQLVRCLLADPPRVVRTQALVQLGRLDLQSGRRAEAVASLEEALGFDPAHREAKYLLGMAFVMQREFERGKAVLDKLVAEDPQPLAYYARAIANHGLKRKAEAQSDIDNAVRLAPNDANIREWQERIRGMK
jgi:Tfp pilus assembly protein PilF